MSNTENSCNSNTTTIMTAIQKIVQAFKNKEKLEKARTLADVVRAMRIKTPEILDKLPRGKDSKNHHLWDIDIDGKSLRDVLRKQWEINRSTCDWRTFCTNLGNEIYFQYKAATGGLSSQYRILGETEYYPEGDDGKKEHGAGGSIPLTSYAQAVCEWIFVGDLKAATPFYFGVQPSSVSDRDGIDKKEETGKEKTEGVDLEVSNQTSFRILLDKKGRYRIPRSLLRGVLRRDLRTAFGGSACNVELGGMKPCDCKVCAIMRRITIRDSRSEYAEPPDIRYRIRMNPYTSTVDEGALFDMEVGPEGVVFPFVLRYRGECLPKELSGVLHYWMDGKALLGGSGSTGKGIFQLTELEVFEWNLNEGIHEYIKEKGRRGEEAEIAKKAYPKGLMPLNLPDKNTLEPYREYLNPLWTKVTYQIKISSPLISADTIHALLDENNRDAIMYEKRVMCGNTGAPKTIPTIKGETIRGIIRTAVGKRCGGLDIDDHEDCPCRLCAIFGNEHEAGKVRFEDLTPVPVSSAQEQHGQTIGANGCSPVQSTPPADAEIHQKYKHIDHVAIDRFHGGAEDAMKFDTYTLAGSPNKPIVLAGALWIKKDILAEYGKTIAGALADVRNGLYPIGGKTGVGYGWVSGFEIIEAPAEFKQLMPKDPELSLSQKQAYSYQDLPNQGLPELKIEPGNIYYPHYFLKPAYTVNREQKMIGHEKFHDEYTSVDGKKEKLISGKITCKLETRTPLVIPDTEKKDVFGLMVTNPKHESYRFFHINNEIMIPGSEIRGMISSVYEAITNSCFRILDEKRYLSWRMKPDKDTLKIFIAGMVKKENGQLIVVEVEKVRLPLYDDINVTKGITSESYSPEEQKRLEKSIEKTTCCNLKIAYTAEKNRTWLLQSAEDDRKKILSGKKEVKFKIKKLNKYDSIAILDTNGDKTGFIKFTGPNNANISNKELPNNGVKDSWNVWELNTLLDSDPRKRVSNKQEYFRPHLVFVKDNYEYIISKRCERVFYSENSNKSLPIPKKVQDDYKRILSEYRENSEQIDKNFCTIFHSDAIREGDLVYFRKNEKNEVDAIIPVNISRTVAKNQLGKKIPENLRPCVHNWLEDWNPEPEFDKRLFSIHPDGLCPACRLFGTTHYKGRVRFGFANLVNKPNWLVGGEGVSGGCVTLPLLERPRPTWSIPSDEFGVPGRKFYVHHNGWREIKENQDKIPKTENNRTVEPLDAGNEFAFDVFFENLKPWELGILLYSLELEPGMGHKLGMGKPLGFGSVKIDVDRLITLNIAEHGLNWNSEENQTGYYIYEGFKKLIEWFRNDKDSSVASTEFGVMNEEMIKGLNAKLSEIAHIQDMRLLLQIPKGNPMVKYPTLNDKSEGCIPGYVYEKLSKEEVLPHEERIKYLTTACSPWNIFLEGTVKWFDKNKGYGFITRHNNKDIYFHMNSIKDKNLLLKEGQKVRFNIKQGKKGPEADTVEIAQ